MSMMDEILSNYVESEDYTYYNIEPQKKSICTFAIYDTKKEHPNTLLIPFDIYKESVKKLKSFSKIYHLSQDRCSSKD